MLIAVIWIGWNNKVEHKITIEISAWIFGTCSQSPATKPHAVAHKTLATLFAWQFVDIRTMPRHIIFFISRAIYIYSGRDAPFFGNLTLRVALKSLLWIFSMYDSMNNCIGMVDAVPSLNMRQINYAKDFAVVDCDHKTRVSMGNNLWSNKSYFIVSMEFWLKAIANALTGGLKSNERLHCARSHIINVPSHRKSIVRCVCVEQKIGHESNQRMRHPMALAFRLIFAKSLITITNSAIDRNVISSLNFDVLWVNRNMIFAKQSHARWRHFSPSLSLPPVLIKIYFPFSSNKHSMKLNIKLVWHSIASFVARTDDAMFCRFSIWMWLCNCVRTLFWNSSNTLPHSTF